MPQGGVDDGSQDALQPDMQRAGQEGGTDTEHCHEHEHDGRERTDGTKQPAPKRGSFVVQGGRYWI